MATTKDKYTFTLTTGVEKSFFTDTNDGFMYCWVDLSNMADDETWTVRVKYKPNASGDTVVEIDEINGQGDPGKLVEIKPYLSPVYLEVTVEQDNGTGRSVIVHRHRVDA